MLEPIDRNTPREKQLSTMKAIDLRLMALGGGGYVGLAFKIKGLLACGFDDQGRPDSVKKLAAYQKASAILNQQGEGATAESFIAAAKN